MTTNRIIKKIMDKMTIIQMGSRIITKKINIMTKATMMAMMRVTQITTIQATKTITTLITIIITRKITKKEITSKTRLR